MSGCEHDTDGDGNCPRHPKGCPPPPADWVKCIRQDRVDELPTQSWCGREVPRGEWAFVDVSHAANNGRNGGRLTACPRCVEAIVAALNGEVRS